MSDPIDLFSQAQRRAEDGDLDGAIALADQAMAAWDAEERSCGGRTCTGFLAVMAQILLFVGFVGLLGRLS